jgi:DNA repair protein SbcC/Rad50
MTLSIEQLRERVVAEVGHTAVEQVSDSILRFTRQEDGLPFAVYYVDLAEELPETQEMLTRYQDRVIGSHYFEGRKSLQWSNYLYFVTTSDRLASSKARQIKELIESDRSYARKFVISEKEVDAVLKPLVIAPSDAILPTNVQSLWLDRLVEARLDGAILSDEDLPTRLALIESPPTELTTKPRQLGRSVEVGTAPFIRSLYLKAFRDFPSQRSFEFGKVNLICGANGSGKTSLLEAIELFYCGRNKRNPDALRAYELEAVLADGRAERADSKHILQIFRDRNLKWYGQHEVKTNNLYRSFAQFNFLDTDAAASLADSTSQIEDDLSRLLIGPDASKTWQVIERVSEAVSAVLRGLLPLKAEIDEELAALAAKRLKESSDSQQESDSICTRLKEMVLRIGWAETQGDKEAGRIVEALSELVSLVRQAAALDGSSVSLNGLAKYCLESGVTCYRAEKDLARLELLRNSQKRLGEAIKRDREALELAEKTKRLILSGLPERVEEENRQQNTVAIYSGWLAGLDADMLGMLSSSDRDVKAVVCHEVAISNRFASEAAFASAKSEYAKYSKMREESLNLAQELRQIAARILRRGTKPDECPLCHARFGPGELAKHIGLGVDEDLEALGKALLIELTERESAVRHATAFEAVSGWLREFSKRAGLAPEVTVRSALDRVEEAKENLAEGQRRLSALRGEAISQEAQGISLTRLDDISGRLRELGYSLPDLSREAVDRLLSIIDFSAASSSQTLEAESLKADELQQMLEAALGTVGSNIPDFRRALSQLKERLAEADRIRAKLDEFSSSFPWPEERLLAEFAVEAESVRRVAAELQAALSRERQAQVTYSESTKRRDLLEKRRDQLVLRIKRLSEAQVTLTTLQKEHSLTDAMSAALDQNRVSIEAIFSQIHSPAEFCELGSSLTTLVRRVDGTEAKLSEISTGQRAAFAMSIFLAQNAQLREGPPVVLIDDPIAHIDDLNSLSFLDYLREVVLKGRRQLFFATANEKLATLFERKFDFLGAEGFCRFDLRRE